MTAGKVMCGGKSSLNRISVEFILPLLPPNETFSLTLQVLQDKRFMNHSIGRVLTLFLFGHFYIGLFVDAKIFTQQQTPVIASITPNFGGVNGGTQITILGVNFNSSSIFTETVVYVGNDRCPVIHHYSSSNKLVCVTPKCTTPTCNNQNIWTGTSTVDVRVYVSSAEGILTPASTPTFTYYNGWTPLIYWTHSSTWGTASMPLLVRSDNVALESFDVLFDDRYHADLGTNNELNDESLTGNSYNYNLLLYYRPPGDMPGGFYNFSMVVQDDFSHGPASTGKATMFDRDRYDNNNYYRFYLFQSTLQGVSYSISLFPSVSAVSPQVGSVGGGTVVTITGTGFSTIPEELEIFVGGLPCVVISSSLNTIQCKTSPKLLPTTVIELFESNALSTTLQSSQIQISDRAQGSPGWWFKVWDATDVWTNQLTHDKINFEFGWKQKFYFSLSDFFGGDWYKTATTEVMYESAVYGFDAGSIFFAPYAGYYTFYVSSDDSSYLYASSDGMEVNEKLVAYNPAFTNAQKFFRYKSQISVAIPLKKGEQLFLRYRGVNTGGYDAFLLAVMISPQYDCYGALMNDWDPQDTSYSCPASLNQSQIISPESNFPETLLQHHSVFETQSLSVSYEFRRERYVVNFTDSTSGAFILVVQGKSVTNTLTFDSSASTIASALNAAAIKIDSTTREVTYFQVWKERSPTSLQITVQFEVDTQTPVTPLQCFPVSLDGKIF
jgi:hypothetical protein